MYKTVNLEQGMPPADQAVRRMTFEINSEKARRVRAIKFIHGFGSSGAGGGIRIKSREYLRSLQRRGAIRFFIPGEDFSIFNENTRKAMELCDALRSDRDLDRHNNGITIVIL